MSSSSSAPPEVSFAVQTVQFLNTTATTLIPSWLTLLLRFILLTAALPLFLVVLSVYIVHALAAWKDQSVEISETPVRYNHIRWTSLPLLPKMEAVLTWNWYRAPKRRK